MATRRTPGSRTLSRLAALLTLAAWCSPGGGAELFRDDFSDFPPGWLTRPIGQLNGRDPGIPLPAAPRACRWGRGPTRSATSTPGPSARRTARPTSSSTRSTTQAG